MDGLRIGRSIRAIRVRLGLRQTDVAERARVSRSFVSKVERGEIEPAALASLERVISAVGAQLDLRVRWRGEGLDRLLDEAHAGLVDAVVALLRRHGWDVALEVTFSIFGERGSMDVLAWHAPTATLLVIEVKSVIADAQGTLSPLDRKLRLAPVVARERGWEPVSVARLLVVADRPINRRRVAGLARLFEAALPDRGHAVRRWLRTRSGALSGLLFLSDSRGGGARRMPAGRLRVNRPRGRSAGVG